MSSDRYTGQKFRAGWAGEEYFELRRADREHDLSLAAARPVIASAELAAACEKAHLAAAAAQDTTRVEPQPSWEQETPGAGREACDD